MESNVAWNQDPIITYRDFDQGKSYVTMIRNFSVQQQGGQLMHALFFFFHWAPEAGAPGCTTAVQAYCTSPTLEVPTCAAR
jgi:hypothetical protein